MGFTNNGSGTGDDNFYAEGTILIGRPIYNKRQYAEGLNVIVVGTGSLATEEYSGSAASDLVLVGNKSVTGSRRQVASSGSITETTAALTVTGVVLGNMVATVADVVSGVYIGTKVGYGAGQLNGTVAIGPEACARNTEALFSVVVGNRALAGNQSNSASTESSVVIGAEASRDANGEFYSNVVIGDSAGRNLSSSNDNVIIGDSAGYSTTTGNDVVYVGSSAGVRATTGQDNTAIGRSAGAHLTTGSSNVLIGYRAGGTEQSTSVGRVLTTGEQNTYVGALSGHIPGGSQVSVTGSNNTLLGYDAQLSSATVSNTVTLGNSSITTLRCQVQSITALSDARDKKNVKNSEYGLDLVKKLRPVTFEWDTRDGAKVGKKDIGFIAQELVEVEDTLGAHETLALTYRDNPEKLEASYGRLVPVLVKAVQELSEKVESLEKKLNK